MSPYFTVRTISNNETLAGSRQLNYRENLHSKFSLQLIIVLQCVIGNNLDNFSSVISLL